MYLLLDLLLNEIEIYSQTAAASFLSSLGSAAALPRSEALAWLGIFFVMAAAKPNHMLKLSSSRLVQSFVLLSGLHSPSRCPVKSFSFFISVPLRFTADIGKNLFLLFTNAPALARVRLAGSQLSSLTSCSHCPAAACLIISDISDLGVNSAGKSGMQACSRSGSPSETFGALPPQLAALGRGIYRATSNMVRCPSLSPSGAAANTKKIPQHF